MWLQVNGRIRAMAVILLVGAVSMLSGCLPDIWSTKTKRLAGDYSLARDSDVYYIFEGTRGETPRGGGALNGIVLQLGWSRDFIVAKRYATVRSDPDGWMVIDVQKKHITGPFSEEEFAAKLKASRELRSITIHDSAKAWKVL